MPNFLRFALFLLVVVAVLGGVEWFLRRRLSAAFDLSPRKRRALTVVFAAGVLATFASRLVERYAPSSAAHVLALIGSVIVLGSVTTFALLLVDSIVRLLVRFALRLRARWTRGAEPAVLSPSLAPLRSAAAGDASAAPREEVIDHERRDFVTKAVAVGAVALGGGTSVYASAVGRTDYVIEEVSIRLARMPRELEGFTIVQLSDLHIGLDVGERELAAALDLVASARPDHIVLTGDLLDNDARFADELGRFVRRLAERAPVSAAIGNHDYYAGIQQTVAALRRAGADVLINEARTLEGKLVLAGVDDVWARRDRGPGPDAARAFAGVNPELPRVLLCHNPSYYPEAADLADLQLSGHTHGGQFSPLVNPARLVLRHGYIRGRYERARQTGDRDDKSQLYVNRGFGTAGPPARIGSPPEVTKLILTG